MKKVLFLSLVLILLLGMANYGTFALFSDTETSTGNTFTAWVEEPCEHDCAAYVIGFEQGLKKNGGSVNEERSHPEEALGEPDGSCNPIEGFVSLGFGGEIVLEFCHYVGGTLTITEITCNQYPLEKVEVWGSTNGTDWVFLGYADNQADMPGSESHVTEIELGENCCIRYVKLVDITDPDDFEGKPDADAFDLDAVCGEPCEVFDGSITVVSDTATMVTEANGAVVDPEENAELAWVHGSWGNITGHTFTAEAEWIWETEYTDDPGSSWPEDGRVVRFEREFCIPCNPTSATLYITVDNGYNAYINGHLIGCAQVDSCAACYPDPCGDCEPCEGCAGCPGWQATDLTEPHVSGSNWTTIETYSINTAWLNVGTNTLEILAGNEQMDGGTKSSNPAGLIFELEVEYGDDCDYCCVDIQD